MAAREVAVETRDMPRPVTQLVQLRPIPIYGLEIGFLRRDLDEVVRGRIERHLATDPDVSLRRRDDSFDVRQDLGPSRKRRGIGVHGKPIALIDVKDGEPLEERDGVGILAGFAGVALVLEPKLAGDGAGSLTFMTVAAALLSVIAITAGALPKGGPDGVTSSEVMYRPGKILRGLLRANLGTALRIHASENEDDVMRTRIALLEPLSG